MSTATYGHEWPAQSPPDSAFIVEIRCVDCGRIERMPIAEPSSFYYGDDGGLYKWGLSFLAVPRSWSRSGFGACQVKRCEACWQRYDAAQEPERLARREAERAAIEAKSVEQLLEDALNTHGGTEFIREALRKVRGTGEMAGSGR